MACPDLTDIKAFYTSCKLCPHQCGVNRYEKKGLCGEGAELRLAWAGLHFGEEPVLTKHGGSGTVFLSGCNLQCAFCQNYQISQDGLGRSVTKDEFVEILLRLQKAGAENINIVTGTHHTAILACFIQEAKKCGLTVPIVWNTSSYESIEMIHLLEGTVDIWLADLKTASAKIAENVFNAPDYFETAKKAIEAMTHRSPLVFTDTENETPQMRSGVILRHLALPSSLPDTFNVLKWFSENLSGKALLSLMTQYTPVEQNKKYHQIHTFENRLINEHENAALRRFLNELHIDDGFYQELCPDYSWLPDFTKVQSFSSALSKPIWHYTKGFI